MQWFENQFYSTEDSSMTKLQQGKSETVTSNNKRKSERSQFSMYTNEKEEGIRHWWVDGGRHEQPIMGASRVWVESRKICGVWRVNQRLFFFGCCCSRTRDWLGTLVKKGREIKTSWGQLGCVLFNIFWAVIGILNIITIIICFTNIWSTFQVVVTLLAYFLFCRWVLVLFFSPNRLHLLVYLFYRSNISRSYLQIWKYSSLTYYIKV